MWALAHTLTMCMRAWCRAWLAAVTGSRPCRGQCLGCTCTTPLLLLLLLSLSLSLSRSLSLPLYTHQAARRFLTIAFAAYSVFSYSCRVVFSVLPCCCACSVFLTTAVTFCLTFRWFCGPIDAREACVGPCVVATAYTAIIDRHKSRCHYRLD